MNEDVADLVRKYAAKGILIDSNILLLFLVGRVDRRRIERFKRTAHFTARDFDLLAQLLHKFQRIVTTPNVMTEIGNLGGQLTGNTLDEFVAVHADSMRSFMEHYVESAAAADTELFTRLGLTDASIGLACKDRYLVLTDDFRLSQVLDSMGVDVINFNHLR